METAIYKDPMDAQQTKIHFSIPVMSERTLFYPGNTSFSYYSVYILHATVQYSQLYDYVYIVYSMFMCVHKRVT